MTIFLRKDRKTFQKLFVLKFRFENAFDVCAVCGCCDFKQPVRLRFRIIVILWCFSYIFKPSSWLFVFLFCLFYQWICVLSVLKVSKGDFLPFFKVFSFRNFSREWIRFDSITEFFCFDLSISFVLFWRWVMIFKNCFDDILSSLKDRVSDEQ